MAIFNSYVSLPESNDFLMGNSSSHGFTGNGISWDELKLDIHDESGGLF